jgi:hypothetical protein
MPAPTDNRGLFVIDDLVNTPSHYTSGNVEVIDIIEQALREADDAVLGYLQGQALKYLLRMWLKDSPVQDAKKARWYLNRLIGKLEGVD